VFNKELLTYLIQTRSKPTAGTIQINAVKSKCLNVSTYSFAFSGQYDVLTGTDNI